MQVVYEAAVYTVLECRTVYGHIKSRNESVTGSALASLVIYRGMVYDCSAIKTVG